MIVVKGGRAKTGVKQRVAILPALEEVLRELRSEYRRVPNTDKRVFTRNGKAIPKGTLRHGFDKAVHDAGVEDFQFRDFRHCARTRWAAAGLPFEIAENGIVSHDQRRGWYLHQSFRRPDSGSLAKNFPESSPRKSER